MQAEEAIRAIELNWPPENYQMLREALTLAIKALKELPTDDEQWALKALRAGFGAKKAVRTDGRWVLHYDEAELTDEQLTVLSDTYVDVGGRNYAGYDTPIAALAAAGRALEEAEKRG